ncbi:hypothetical protein M0R19_06105 [Candidatus Pacearchaeota archaeon]|jgi:hypothetical protein|nr:hypothetical protein [Candidatus Pacearchaeota archaeon]
MKIYILHPSDGWHRQWSELDDSELDEWKADGSLIKGDLIIFPEKILIVEEKNTLLLKQIG